MKRGFEERGGKKTKDVVFDPTSHSRGRKLHELLSPVIRDLCDALIHPVKTGQTQCGASRQSIYYFLGSPGKLSLLCR